MSPGCQPVSLIAAWTSLVHHLFFLMAGHGKKLDLKVSSFARLDVVSGSQQGWHKMRPNQVPPWSFIQVMLVCLCGYY